MFVEERMSKNVTTVKPDDTVAKTFQILKETKHSQLPVIDDSGKLVGLVTEKLLAEVSPSKATSLSIFEINYLLSKTKVKDIMKKDVFTTNPEKLIEQAALVMRNNDIGSLPVVDENNLLVGIVTRRDIFSAFVDIMGVGENGSRIVLEVPDTPGILADIASIIKDYDLNILHMSNYNVEGDKVEVVFKVNSPDVDELVRTLENHNYKVLSIRKKL